MSPLRLILMRHAKSSWDNAELPDHDRTLNARGRRSCAAIGAWLAERGYQPDQILCSSAERTRETWARLSEHLPGAPAAEIRRDLYLAEPDQMLQALQGATGRTVAMLGHNPGIGAFAAQLLASAPAHARFGAYPTLATLVADFDIPDWGALVTATGWPVDFIVPRDLTD